MIDSHEQPAVLKFFFLFEKTSTQTLGMYKDDVIEKNRVPKWFSRFTIGEMLIDDKLGPDRRRC